jgi:5-methylcytosine-specific restriction endonuclease McrA
MAPRRFGPASRVALFLAARGRCAECGVLLRPGWHADHVMPVRAGGATEPANGRALCPACNLHKGGKLP